MTKPRPLQGREESKTIFLTWPMIERAVDHFAMKLKHKQFDSMVALVRGGVIPATFLSHRLNKRNLHFLQGRRTASNRSHDYCSLSILSFPKINRGEHLLFVEDIIFQGETVSRAIEIIRKKKGLVVGIFALVVDRYFLSSPLFHRYSKIPLFAGFVCDHLTWVRFPWEQRITGETQCQ